ncbi:MAG: ribosomal protein S18-alanine N-acetyltransferase [Microbacterium enclense]
MEIRPATLDDLDAIMALEHASFPTDAWSPAMMREELLSPHGWYVVAEEAGRPIGYAGLRAVRGARDADVQTITITETARGRGRGRALLAALLDEAARREVHDVFLDVRADNPVAQALYASEGFVEVGRRARYYQPDDVDAIVMQLDLRGWAARRAEGVASGASAGTGAAASASADPEMRIGSGATTPIDPDPRSLPGSATAATTGKGWC